MKKFLSVLALLLIPSITHASTILQFTEVQPFNTPFTLTSNGSSTTLTANKAVNVIFDPSFCLVNGCGGVTNGIYELTLDASSLSPASVSGSAVSEQFGGTLSLTNGSINLLSVSFTDLLEGSLGGSSPTLEASQPPDFFSGSSNVFDPSKLGVPRGFSLSFSNLNGGLALDGTTIHSGVMDGTGTFSATPIPEPTSMMLLGTGLLGLVSQIKRKNRSL